MLAGLGYRVVASTGKNSEHDYLRALGASEILPRDEVGVESKRPLDSERWAGAIDPVGGVTTAYLLRTTKYRGSIALSGLAGGMDLPTSVLPFILRGVNLLGIDSVQCPQPLRHETWRRLADDLKPAGLLESIAVRTDLDGIADVAARILRGEARGRTLVTLA
jgi:putative YhdH/YhfP family quinone oxidoreductase